MPNQTKELCKVMLDFMTGYSAGKDISTFLTEVNSKEGKNLLCNLIRPFFPKEKNPLPKRPKTAYGFFKSYAGKKIRKKYPGIDQKSLLEKVGKLWSAMSPEKKKKYEEMAAAEKDSYEKEKSIVLDRCKPRKPPSSFIFYCREKRAEVVKKNPRISFSEISVKLGEMWREEDDKSTWEEMADVCNKEYHEKIKAWKEKQATEKMVAKRVKKNPVLGMKLDL